MENVNVAGSSESRLASTSRVRSESARSLSRYTLIVDPVRESAMKVIHFFYFLSRERKIFSRDGEKIFERREDHRSEYLFRAAR